MIEISNEIFRNEQYPINIEEDNQLIIIENIRAYQSNGIIRVRGKNNFILIRNLFISCNSTDDNLKQIAITDDVLALPTNKVVIDNIHCFEGAGSYIFLQNCADYYISNVTIDQYGKLRDMNLNIGHSYAIKIDNYKFQNQKGTIDNVQMNGTNRISTLGGERWESSRYNAVWLEDGVRFNLIRNSQLDCNLKLYSDPEEDEQDAGGNNDYSNITLIGDAAKIVDRVDPIL